MKNTLLLGIPNLIILILRIIEIYFIYLIYKEAKNKFGR